jgi:peroxiredoxin Q/BCP
MKPSVRHAALCTTLALLAASASRSAEPVDLKVGDPAPRFEALDDTGKPWKSTDHVGKQVMVVYFYPADMTGGCTKQACGYRDDLGKLKEQGVSVVGVSGDTVHNHERFKKAYDLNYTLLADTEGKVAAAFGVPATAGLDSVTAAVAGKDELFIRPMTIKRWTFVIDKDGKIAARNTDVKAADDSKAILETVEKLKK